MGNSATTAGEKFIPFMIAIILARYVSGVITTVFLVYRPIIVIGGALATTGDGLMNRWTRDSSLGTQIGFLLIGRFGLGCFIHAGFCSAQAPTQKEDLPVTTGLVSFCRSLGGAIETFTPAIITATLDQNEVILSTLPIDIRNSITDANVALPYVFYAVTGLMAAVTLLSLATIHDKLSKENNKQLKETEEA